MVNTFYIVAGERNMVAAPLHKGLYANVGQTSRDVEDRLRDDDYKRKAAGGKWTIIYRQPVGDLVTVKMIHPYLKQHPDVVWDAKSDNTEEFFFKDDPGDGSVACRIVTDIIRQTCRIVTDIIQQMGELLHPKDVLNDIINGKRKHLAPFSRSSQEMLINLLGDHSEENVWSDNQADNIAEFVKTLNDDVLVRFINMLIVTKQLGNLRAIHSRVREHLIKTLKAATAWQTEDVTVDTMHRSRTPVSISIPHYKPTALSQQDDEIEMNWPIALIVGIIASIPPSILFLLYVLS